MVAERGLAKEAGEGEDLRLERSRRMAKRITAKYSVEVNNGWISIWPEKFGSPYGIELSRIDSYATLVAWVHHIAKKPWGKRELIRDFMEAVFNNVEGLERPRLKP